MQLASISRDIPAPAAAAECALAIWRAPGCAFGLSARRRRPLALSAQGATFSEGDAHPHSRQLAFRTARTRKPGEVSNLLGRKLREEPFEPIVHRHLLAKRRPTRAVVRHRVTPSRRG
jgi:hypothetical protein